MGNADSAVREKFEDDFIEQKRKGIVDIGTSIKDEFESFINKYTPPLLIKNIKRLKQMYKIKKKHKCQKDLIFKVQVIEHKKSKRLFLLKSIKKKQIIDGVGMNNFLHMFMNMMVSLDRVRHPNIETLVSVSFDRKTIDESELFIVTNYTTKDSLIDYANKFISAKRIIPEAEISHIMKVLIQAVYQIKHNNIINKGLNPETIFFQKGVSINTLCITNFYFSSLVEEDEKRRGASGSLWYMSPEMLKDIEYDFKTDVWSLGIILYILLFRENPFKNCSSKEEMLELIKKKVWSKTHKEITTLGVNKEAVLLMEKMLDPIPMNRSNIENLLTDKFILDFEDNRTNKAYRSLSSVESIEDMISKIEALPELHNMIFYIIYNLTDYILSREEISEINYYYKLFDINNDGLVSFGEIENTLQELDYKATKPYVTFLKAILDCDFRRQIIDKILFDYVDYLSFLAANVLIKMFKEYSNSFSKEVRELAVKLALVNNDELKEKKSVYELSLYYKNDVETNKEHLRELKEDLENIADVDERDINYVREIQRKLEEMKLDKGDGEVDEDALRFEKRVSNLFYELDEDESGDISIGEIQSYFQVKYKLDVKQELKKIRTSTEYEVGIIEDLETMNLADFKNFFSYEIVRAKQ